MILERFSSFRSFLTKLVHAMSKAKLPGLTEKPFFGRDLEICSCPETELDALSIYPIKCWNRTRDKWISGQVTIETNGKNYNNSKRLFPRDQICWPAPVITFSSFGLKRVNRHLHCTGCKTNCENTDFEGTARAGAELWEIRMDFTGREQPLLCSDVLQKTISSLGAVAVTSNPMTST